MSVDELTVGAWRDALHASALKVVDALLIAERAVGRSPAAAQRRDSEREALAAYIAQLAAIAAILREGV